MGGGWWSTEDNSETTFSYFSTEMFAVSPHEGSQNIFYGEI